MLNGASRSSFIASLVPSPRKLAPALASPLTPSPPHSFRSTHQTESSNSFSCLLTSRSLNNHPDQTRRFGSSCCSLERQAAAALQAPAARMVVAAAAAGGLHHEPAAGSIPAAPSNQEPQPPGGLARHPSGASSSQDEAGARASPPFTTACLSINPASFGPIPPGRDPLHPGPEDSAALQRAVLLLQQGAVVAMPTETVYGLAANALDAEAVRRIFAAKGRPIDNPLIVHISSMDMLYSLYPPGWSLPPTYTAALAALWPGPLTVLLPRSPLVPDVVTCGQPTMAVRMPSHPVARALIAAAGFPLAAPSANSSGRPSPTSAAHVMADLAGRVPLVLDGGACGCGVESTVLDALRQPPAVLRPGGATYEQLRELPGLEGLQVYRRDFVDSKLEEAPTTPGMKYRHYSPDAMVVLIDVTTWSGAPEALAAAVREQSQRQLQRLAAQGLRSLALLRTTATPGTAPGLVAGSAAAGGACAPVAPAMFEYVLGSLDAPAGVARELFSALRLVDELGAQAVVVEGVRERDEGLAVMNRLRKAASCVVRLDDDDDCAGAGGQ